MQFYPINNISHYYYFVMLIKKHLLATVLSTISIMSSNIKYIIIILSNINIIIIKCVIEKLAEQGKYKGNYKKLS